MEAEFSVKAKLEKQHLQKRVREGTGRALDEAGEGVRQSARQSLRKNGQVSRPGEPPSVHSTDPKRSLLNMLVSREEGPPAVVYIGPIPITLTRRSSGYRSKLTVPELLEQGGEVQVIRQRDGRMEKSRNVSDMRLRLLQRSGRLQGVGRELSNLEDDNLRSSVYQYQARPYMRPAMEREAKSGAMLGHFKNSVRE